jgi:hypothetical protein
VFFETFVIHGASPRHERSHHPKKL